MAAILFLADGPMSIASVILDNIKTNFKFEVDWGNGSKDTAFTRVVHSKHFQKFNGGYLVFNRWPKIKASVLLIMKNKFQA